jgi:hypothetical protein
MGVRPPSLSVSPVWPHGSISQFRCNPHCGGDRFEGRMQDGTVTTESTHGRVGLVGSLPTGLHPGLVHVYTLCRVVQSIATVASSVMDMSFDSFVLMFWDFYLPL